MKGCTLFLVCTGIAAILSACTNPLKEERKGILPHDSIISEAVMVQLLADVHILEAGLLVRRNHGERISATADEYYRDLFSKYRISADRFRLNLRYYQWDTDEFSALYEKVIVELKSRQDWITSSNPVKKPASK
jgi:hypothetical protein